MLEELESISKAKVMVVGDLMLDRYWWGSVTRISPEAPVPVVSMERESIVAGGAGNVAANVVGLGASVELCGVVGNDVEGQQLIGTLAEKGISTGGIVKCSDRPTTVKTRILAHKHQVARIDREFCAPIDEATFEKVLSVALAMVNRCDVIVISDYNKGLLTEELIAAIIKSAAASGKVVVVDPKGRDFSKYKGASILTPNLKEAVEATGSASSDTEALVDGGRRLIAALSLDALLVTRGEQGMLLVRPGVDALALEATAREVYDVTGAGDTVISTLACGLAAGLSLEDSIRIANEAAGIVIEHVGTTAITPELLLGRS